MPGCRLVFTLCALRCRPLDHSLLRAGTGLSYSGIISQLIIYLPQIVDNLFVLNNGPQYCYYQVKLI